jgi:hypothetical protein
MYIPDYSCVDYPHTFLLGAFATQWGVRLAYSIHLPVCTYKTTGESLLRFLRNLILEKNI